MSNLETSGSHSLDKLRGRSRTTQSEATKLAVIVGAAVGAWFYEHINPNKQSQNTHPNIAAATQTLEPHAAQLDHQEDEHLSQEEIDAMFESELQHDFFKDPQEWMAKHGEKARDLFEKIEGGDLVCIDDGIQNDDDGIVHEAGAGILFKSDQYKNIDHRRHAYKYELAEQDVVITEVTSHEGCGAAAMAAKAAGFEGDPDEFGKMWAQQLAKDLHVPHRHISAKEMERPSSLHNVTAILYCAGNTPDYKDTGLPQMMNISRGALGNSEHALTELKVAIQILRGKHGFGERFTKEKPLRIVVPSIQREPELSEQAFQEALQAAEGNDWIQVIRL